MHVELLDDPVQFLAQSDPLRSTDPILTNVLGSVAQSVAAGDRRYERCWWWLIREAGVVVGAAMRTAPFSLLLAPMRDGAAAALGEAVSTADPGLPGVNGPEHPARAVIGALAQAGDRRRWQVGTRQLVYELGSLEIPEVPGHARVATAADLDLALAWHKAFHEEIDNSQHDEAAVRARVQSGATYLWCDEDTPVSLAGHAHPVAIPGGALTRVGPVYTPPELRRHGYAAAVTAACSAALLERGSRVMLYTDAANPTSNGVYTRLGYRQIGDTVAYEPA